MLAFLYLLMVHPVFGFNLDKELRKIVGSPEGTTNYFGYSVKFFQHQSKGIVILVGAPKADTYRLQPGVDRGGGMFDCSITHSSCSAVVIDRHPFTETLNGSSRIPIDNRDNQFLGATIDTDSNGRVLVCAPLYKYRTPSYSKRDPTGDCYLATDASLHFKPTRSCILPQQDGYHRLGVATCGVSGLLPDAVSPKDRHSIYVGGPGGFYWQGVTIRQEIIGQRTKTIKAPLLAETDPVDSSTNFWKDNHYRGYSMATGEFNGQPGQDVAVGGPRGALENGPFPGIVVIYGSDLKNLWNISGDSDGSYFGAAIATCDINGDGFVDLIIGAPLYSDRKKGGRMIHEVGRVYVYYQRPWSNFVEQRRTVITGDTEWGRFGHAVVCAGDLDKDGVNDIVVGAPYYREPDQSPYDKSSGAIYVFNGRRHKDIRTEPSQIVKASEINDGLRSFGFSLDAGIDADGNGYPDVVAGAYQSAHIVYFPSLPIVKITSDVFVKSAELDLEEKKCAAGVGGEPAACSKFKLCSSFENRDENVRARRTVLDVRTDITLDVHGTEVNRAVFLDSPTTNRKAVTTRLRTGVDNCKEYHFVLNPNIRDKLSDLVVHVNYSLVDTAGAERPVLDHYGTKFVELVFEMKKNCGRDKICIPRLSVESQYHEVCSEVEDPISNLPVPGFSNCTMNAPLTPGDHKFINIFIQVKNSGENGYLSILEVKIPAGLEFGHHVAKSDHRVICAPADSPDPAFFETMSCELGNPLRAGSLVNIMFQLKVKDTALKNAHVEFVTNATNNDSPTDRTIVKIDIDRNAKLVLFASSNGNVEYQPRDATPITQAAFASQLGPNVTHRFQVRNDGTLTYKSVRLNIFLPTKTAVGNHLLYVVSSPKEYKSGPGHGEVVCSSKVGDIFNMERLGLGRPDAPPQRTARDAETNYFIHSDLRNAIREVENDVSPALVSLDCSTGFCAHFECIVSNLGPGRRWIMVQIESYLVIDSLVKEGIHRGAITSLATAELVEGGADFSLKGTHTWATARTLISSRESPQTSDEIPWWVWAIAIFAALILLLLVALLLWRFGFFKRNRPPKKQALLTHAPEEQYYGYPRYGEHL